MFQPCYVKAIKEHNPTMIFNFICTGVCLGKKVLICGAGPIGLVNLITAKDNIACKILVKIEADSQVLEVCTIFQITDL